MSERRPQPAHSIDLARADDRSAVEAIAVAARMFEPADVGFLGEMLGEHQATDEGREGWLVARAEDGTVLGATHFAPEPFADRMWNLYFIAVDPRWHGRGLGQALMAEVESRLRCRGSDVARTLIVETSSTDQYERTRRFYEQLGYVEEARIRQFYGPEDHKVVFWKQLTAG